MLEKGEKIAGAHGKTWRVIESIDANCLQVKNGLQAIAVVPSEQYDPLKTQYDDIIVAFRGTSSEAFDDDIPTDIKQITFGVKKNYHMYGAEIKNIETTFETGLKWVKQDIIKKYKPSSLHTTGHSKGADEADFVAAELNCYATTYTLV